MFGCVVAGRQIQTNLQQVSEGKYVFTLPEPTKINHLVVFVTGTISQAHINVSSCPHIVDLFQEGYGASLYYNTARQQGSGAPWQFLGVLTNQKPSAIFRVKQAQPGNEMEDSFDGDQGEVGISIETLAVLESLQNEKSLTLSTPISSDSAKSTVQRLAEHAMNFLGSFAKPASAFGSQEPVVPLRSLQDWYNNMMRKAQVDPHFLQK